MTPFQIRWSFLRPASNGHSLDSGALVLELDDDTLAVWVETGSTTHTVRDRSPARIVVVDQPDTARDIDVFDDSGSLVAAISVDAAGQLRYARTMLLEEAGLPAGGCNPPVAEEMAAAVRRGA